MIETNNKNVEESVSESDGSKGLIQIKIVYWGPGESGKTTSFHRIREMYSSTKLTDGYSIQTTDGRTLWQDSVFLKIPVEIGKNKYILVTQIVTCTGQERFLATREYVLNGADGIIFVADSDPDKLEEDKRSFREMVSFAKPNNVQYLIQLNKRDLPNAIDIADFKRALKLPKEEKFQDGTYVVYPTTATEGRNVALCFKHLTSLIMFESFK